MRTNVVVGMTKGCGLRARPFDVFYTWQRVAIANGPRCVRQETNLLSTRSLSRWNPKEKNTQMRRMRAIPLSLFLVCFSCRTMILRSQTHATFLHVYKSKSFFKERLRFFFHGKRTVSLSSPSFTQLSCDASRIRRTARAPTPAPAKATNSAGPCVAMAVAMHTGHTMISFFVCRTFHEASSA